MAISGRVSKIVGNVYAKDQNGMTRELKVGDEVFLTDVIITPNGSAVTIISNTGKIVDYKGEARSVADIFADYESSSNSSNISADVHNRKVDDFDYKLKDNDEIMGAAQFSAANPFEDGGHLYAELHRDYNPTLEPTPRVDLNKAVGGLGSGGGSGAIDDTSSKPSGKILTIKDNVGSIQGDLKKPYLTDDTQPEIIVKKPSDGSTPKIVDKNGNEIPSDIKNNPDGTVSITPKNHLPEGDNTIKIIDGDGETEVKITIDTTAPNKPEIIQVDQDKDASDGWKTSDNTPTITIKVEEGSTPTFKDKNGNLIDGKLEDKGNGNFEFTPKNPITSNEEIQVTTTDKAGNESDPTKFKVEIDTTAGKTIKDTTTTITKVGTDENLQDGIDKQKDTKPTIEGKVENIPNDCKVEKVKVEYTDKDGKPQTEEATVDSDGKFSFTPKNDLKDGATTEIKVTPLDAKHNNAPGNEASVEIPVDTKSITLESVIDHIDTLVYNNGHLIETKPGVHVQEFNTKNNGIKQDNDGTYKVSHDKVNFGGKDITGINDANPTLTFETKGYNEGEKFHLTYTGADNKTTHTIDAEVKNGKVTFEVKNLVEGKFEGEKTLELLDANKETKAKVNLNIDTKPYDLQINKTTVDSSEVNSTEHIQYIGLDGQLWLANGYKIGQKFNSIAGFLGEIQKNSDYQSVATFKSHQINYKDPTRAFGGKQEGIYDPVNGNDYVKNFLNSDANNATINSNNIINQDKKNANFGLLKLTGKVYLQKGTYEFTSTADDADGMFLNIDNNTIIGSGDLNKPVRSGSYAKAKYTVDKDGWYDITIYKFDANANSQARIEVSKDGGEKHIFGSKETFTTQDNLSKFDGLKQLEDGSWVKQGKYYINVEGESDLPENTDITIKDQLGNEKTVKVENGKFKATFEYDDLQVKQVEYKTSTDFNDASGNISTGSSTFAGSNESQANIIQAIEQKQFLNVESSYFNASCYAFYFDSIKYPNKFYNDMTQSGVSNKDYQAKIIEAFKSYLSKYPNGNPENQSVESGVKANDGKTNINFFEGYKAKILDIEDLYNKGVVIDNNRKAQINFLNGKNISSDYDKNNPDTTQGNVISVDDKYGNKGDGYAENYGKGGPATNDGLFKFSAYLYVSKDGKYQFKSSDLGTFTAIEIDGKMYYQNNETGYEPGGTTDADAKIHTFDDIQLDAGLHHINVYHCDSGARGYLNLTINNSTPNSSGAKQQGIYLLGEEFIENNYANKDFKIDGVDQNGNPYILIGKVDGSNKAEIIKGTDHKDIIDGNGGKDVIESGKGDDTIVYREGTLKIDGGEGNDTLLIKDSTLDFSNINKIDIKSVENIKLGDNKTDTTLNINAKDLLDFGGTNNKDLDTCLKISGNDKDKVNLSKDFKESTATESGYKHYEANVDDVTVHVKIEDDVSINVM